MPNNIKVSFQNHKNLSINDETMTAIKQHGVHRRKGGTDNFFYLGNFNVGENDRREGGGGGASALPCPLYTECYKNAVKITCVPNKRKESKVTYQVE